MARQLVEAAGFEAFDPWAATLHAAPSWFDPLPTVRGGHRKTGGLEYEIHSAEALSDMVTQMFLNQLCTS